MQTLTETQKEARQVALMVAEMFASQDNRITGIYHEHNNQQSVYNFCLMGAVGYVIFGEELCTKSENLSREMRLNEIGNTFTREFYSIIESEVEERAEGSDEFYFHFWSIVAWNDEWENTTLHVIDKLTEYAAS